MKSSITEMFLVKKNHFNLDQNKYSFLTMWQKKFNKNIKMLDKKWLKIALKQCDNMIDK